jgi:hypothetical protein
MAEEATRLITPLTEEATRLTPLTEEATRLTPLTEVAAKIRLRNLRNSQASYYDRDFTLRAGDRRVFEPVYQQLGITSGEPADALIVQPGLALESLVVFDLAPDARDLVFRAIGIDSACRRRASRCAATAPN